MKKLIAGMALLAASFPLSGHADELAKAAAYARCSGFMAYIGTSDNVNSIYTDSEKAEMWRSASTMFAYIAKQKIADLPSVEANLDVLDKAYKAGYADASNTKLIDDVLEKLNHCTGL